MVMSGLKIKKEIDQNEVLKSMEEYLSEMIDERNKLYRTIQSFSVDAISTDKTMAKLRRMTTEIKKQQTRVDKKKKELGWLNADIKLSRKERK